MGDPATVGEDALDVKALEEISTITGGRFFLALDRDELDGVYDELDRIEPELIETLSYQPKRGLFHVPLAIAAVLMGLLALIMLSRRGSARAEKAHA
jgi:Ca-activated chloride channel family protein